MADVNLRSAGGSAWVTADGGITDRPAGSISRYRRLVEYLRASVLLRGTGQLSFVWVGSLDAVHDGGLPARVRMLERAQGGWDVFVEPLSTADVDALSARELQVLTLLACGLTNPVIADRLAIARRTVATHVEAILSKLDVHTRAAAAAVAIDRDLVALPLQGSVDELAPLDVVRMEQAVRGTSRIRTRTSRPRMPRHRPLVIGSVYPTSSGSRSDGRSMERGATLAIEELNFRGGVSGRRIEHLTMGADVTDASSVRSAVLRLVEQDVDAITMSYTFDRSQVGFAAQFGPASDVGCPVLHHSTSVSAARLVAEDPGSFGNVFQVCPPESSYGDGFLRTLDALCESGEWKPRSRRLLILDSADPDLKTFPLPSMDAAEEAGWNVTIEPITTSRLDWAAFAVERIQMLDPAAVMIACFSAIELASFLRLHDTEPTGALLYALYAPSVAGFLERAGRSAEGLIWATVTGRYGDRLGNAFDLHYQLRFHDDPGRSSAGIHYDMVHLLAGAWSHCGTPRDFARVNEQLKRIIHRGVNGVYDLSALDQTSLSYPDHTPDPSVSQAHLVHQIQDGRHQILAPGLYAGAPSRLRRS